MSDVTDMIKQMVVEEIEKRLPYNPFSITPTSFDIKAEKRIDKLEEMLGTVWHEIFDDKYDQSGGLNEPKDSKREAEEIEENNKKLYFECVHGVKREPWRPVDDETLHSGTAIDGTAFVNVFLRFNRREQAEAFLAVVKQKRENFE